jgi:hypothetical protein
MTSKLLDRLKKDKEKNLERLQEKAEELDNPRGRKQSNKQDDGFWKPSKDPETKKGSALIRFLPSVIEEDDPYITYWDHYFKGDTGMWYVQKSRRTINESDPVAIHLTELWNAGDKDKYYQRKKRQHFVANILVKKDPLHPENEGKVFHYRFGKTIYDKMKELMNPSFESDEPINPFCPLEGADFQIRIKPGAQMPDYSDCKFGSKSKLAASEKEMEKILSEVRPLQPYVAPENFKSFDDLKALLEKVDGVDLDGKGGKPEQFDEEFEYEDDSLDDINFDEFEDLKD